MIRLFNMDLHVSVIEDLKYILKDLYGEKIDITRWSLSSHSHIFDQDKKDPEIINSSTWNHLTEEMMIEFADKYSSFLESFDGFIVTHTPIFCLIYQRFNKPVILINSCRYEQPYCWNNNINMWNKLHLKLLEMYEKNILTVISNNKADNEYIEMGTTIKSKHIPSLCLYTKENYFPLRKNFMLNLSEITRFSLKSHPNISRKENLSHNYKWSELYHYKGIIHFPYEISTMSIFEQYSANIPLFFPSKEYLKKMLRKDEYHIQSRYNLMYGNNPYHSTLRKALHDMYWIDYWVDRADFYDDDNMKYITYFDSIEDLFEKIEKISRKELIDISKNMKEHNILRKERVYKEWKQIFDKIFDL